MNKKKKVMVIGHEASLSGAPVLLLNLFRLLVKSEIVEVQFVIRRGGPLVKEYEKIGPVIVMKQPNYGEEKSFFLHLLHFVQNKIKLLIVLIKAFWCDCFFFNTVVNGKLLRWLQFHKKPVITYVHELQRVIDLYIIQKDAVLPLNGSDIILFPSNLTKELLMNMYHIPEQRLKKLTYYFPFAKTEYDSDKAFDFRLSFRQRFGVKGTEFLVGAVGTVSERKGVDLFIETCEKVILFNPLIKFIWIGSFESDKKELEFRNLIKEKQLDANLIFAGGLSYDIYNFSPLDVFFLSSKEDTYPLVVLEAAIMKVPSICFSGSGGIVEFIQDEAGWLIDDFSTGDAAKKIIELQKDKKTVQLYGNAAFDRVISLHCNPEKIIDQFNSAIANVVN